MSMKLATLIVTFVAAWVFALPQSAVSAERGKFPSKNDNVDNTLCSRRRL